MTSTSTRYNSSMKPIKVESWKEYIDKHPEVTGCLIDNEGHRAYFKNGKCHREDGPASIYANGDKYWYLNGKCHRTDGPAVEFADGIKRWWLNGKYLSEREHRLAVRQMKIKLLDNYQSTL